MTLHEDLQSILERTDTSPIVSKGVLYDADSSTQGTKMAVQAPPFEPCGEMATLSSFQNEPLNTIVSE